MAGEDAASRLLANLSAALLRCGLRQQALEAAEDGYAAGGNEVKCLYRQGEALLALGEAVQALGVLDQAIVRAPEDAQLLRKAGEARELVRTQTIGAMAKSALAGKPLPRRFEGTWTDVRAQAEAAANGMLDGSGFFDDRGEEHLSDLAEGQPTHKQCLACGYVTDFRAKACRNCQISLVGRDRYKAVNRDGTPWKGARGAARSKWAHTFSSAEERCEPPPPKGQEGETAAARAAVLGDPALQAHYDALGVPQGAGEPAVRAAYLSAVWENHPDQGGEEDDYRRVCEAYEAHAEAMTRVWEMYGRGDGNLLEAPEAGGGGGGAAVGASAAPAGGQPASPPAGDATGGLGAASPASAPAGAAGDLPERIFVSMVCYRDAEGQHTLRDLFAKARHPERLRVGVVWQFFRHPTDEVTRAFKAVNETIDHVERVIAALPEEQRDERGSRIAMDTMPELRAQQRTEQSLEAAAHSAACLGPRLAAQVRELRLDYRAAEGASYARHLASRLWAGEELFMQIDSHMRFEPGWDVKLEAWLRRCPSTKPILTGLPLGYRRRADTVGRMYDPNERDMAGIHQGAVVYTGDIGEPGEAVLPKSRAPCVPCLMGFDARRALPTVGCRPLRGRATGDSPLRVSLWAPMFSFSRAEALLRDAPYDPHLAHCRGSDLEALAMSARLWCRGYDFFVPPEAVVFHNYDTAYRPGYEREDVRAGLQLYADESEGRPADAERNDFLAELAERRVRAVLGVADDEWQEIALGLYGLDDAARGDGGADTERSAAAFWGMVGADVRARRVTAEGALAGRAASDFDDDTRREAHFLPRFGARDKFGRGL